MSAVYELPENPVYNEAIRKLQNDDPANADAILNPLVQALVDNIHYVKLQSETAADELVRAIMTNELTLPLAAGTGEELLTGGGTPILAVYYPAGAAALSDLDKRLSDQITTAKAEAVSDAGEETDAKISAHNASTASHPAHLVKR